MECRALADDADRGAFLEVDLEYPAELHESHNDYPLCPERMPVPRSWLSPYAVALAGSITPSVRSSSPI